MIHDQIGTIVGRLRKKSATGRLTDARISLSAYADWPGSHQVQRERSGHSDLWVKLHRCIN